MIVSSPRRISMSPPCEYASCTPSCVPAGGDRVTISNKHVLNKDAPVYDVHSEFKCHKRPSLLTCKMRSSPAMTDGPKRPQTVTHASSILCNSQSSLKLNDGKLNQRIRLDPTRKPQFIEPQKSGRKTTLNYQGFPTPSNSEEVRLASCKDQHEACFLEAKHSSKLPPALSGCATISSRPEVDKTQRSGDNCCAPSVRQTRLSPYVDLSNCNDKSETSDDEINDDDDDIEDKEDEETDESGEDESESEDEEGEEEYTDDEKPENKVGTSDATKEKDSLNVRVNTVMGKGFNSPEKTPVVPVRLQCSRNANVSSILGNGEMQNPPCQPDIQNPSKRRQRCAFVLNDGAREAQKCKSTKGDGVSKSSSVTRVLSPAPIAHSPPPLKTNLPRSKVSSRETYSAPVSLRTRSVGRSPWSATSLEHDGGDPCSTWVEQGLDVHEADDVHGQELNLFISTAPASRHSVSSRHGVRSPFWRQDSVSGSSACQDKAEELAIVAERLVLHQEDDSFEHPTTADAGALDSDNDDRSVEEEPDSPHSLSSEQTTSFGRSLSFQRDPHGPFSMRSSLSSTWHRPVHDSVVPVPRPRRSDTDGKGCIDSSCIHDSSVPKSLTRPCVQSSCIAIDDGNLHAPAMALVDCHTVCMGSPPYIPNSSSYTDHASSIRSSSLNTSGRS